MTSYAEFLQKKSITDVPTGLDVIPELCEKLFPFQRDIVRWALRRGRSAIFADCGMGKTAMQLEWAKHIPGNVLVLAPLAVAQQTVREAEKFGINSIAYARDSNGELPHITITNYEMLGRFDVSRFVGVVLDESSILKSYMGKTKRALVDRFRDTRFKLACTATPAPNDHMELGNHAEWLGVMDSNEMLARWFINDAAIVGNYRLKNYGKVDFWRWVSSWAIALSKPSDIGDFDDTGYTLPGLEVNVETVESAPPVGELFHLAGTLSATEIHREKRASAPARAGAVADFCNGTDEQCLVWCDSNYESDAVVALIPDAVEVRGSDSQESKERALMNFVDGKIRVLVTKPSIAGFGMNFQNCHRVAFIGLSYSFESLYQALRRVYRFGQKSSITALIVESQNEGGIRANVMRKMKDHENMQQEMIANMSDFQNQKGRKLAGLPEPVLYEDDSFKLYNGDCVDVLTRKIADNSIDYSIFSPPFANLYIYSESVADMGNCADHEEFFSQMAFLIRELYRVTVNGRLCSVHCKDLPAYKGRDGAAGLVDFPGHCVAAFERCGWQFHSRVTIWKDPVTEMQRTKNHGLLHKQLCKDSSASRQGMADYVLTFRKWDGDVFPRPIHGPTKECRFPISDGYVGEEGPANVMSERDHSIQVWQRYASPVWFDIRQTNVLQGSKHATSEEDERHICPLQLDVIERCIHLWSNPGDIVFSPFAGIGSEGHVALKMGRSFVGTELKRSYFEQACKNLNQAKTDQGNLFSDVA